MFAALLLDIGQGQILRREIANQLRVSHVLPRASLLSAAHDYNKCFVSCCPTVRLPSGFVAAVRCTVEPQRCGAQGHPHVSVC